MPTLSLGLRSPEEREQGEQGQMRQRPTFAIVSGRIAGAPHHKIIFLNVRRREGEPEGTVPGCSGSGTMGSAAERVTSGEDPTIGGRRSLLGNELEAKPAAFAAKPRNRFTDFGIYL